VRRYSSRTDLSKHEPRLAAGRRRHRRFRIFIVGLGDRCLPGDRFERRSAFDSGRLVRIGRAISAREQDEPHHNAERECGQRPHGRRDLSGETARFESLLFEDSGDEAASFQGGHPSTIRDRDIVRSRWISIRAGARDLIERRGKFQIARGGIRAAVAGRPDTRRWQYRPGPPPPVPTTGPAREWAPSGERLGKPREPGHGPAIDPARTAGRATNHGQTPYSLRRGHGKLEAQPYPRPDRQRPGLAPQGHVRREPRPRARTRRRVYDIRSLTATAIVGGAACDNTAATSRSC
jgi:hypothetical protein